MRNWSDRIAEALASEFKVRGGAWYAAIGGPDLEWSLKAVDGNKFVIRANDSDESGDAYLEVTITVSKPKRVKE